MVDVREVGCCALEVIVDAASTLRSFPDDFDKALVKNHKLGTDVPNKWKGQYKMATIVVISTNWLYIETVAELKKRNFKLLGTFTGAHEDRGIKYNMEIWGQNITTPGEIK